MILCSNSLLDISLSAFTLDKWIHIPQLAALTFDTRFVSVTADEARSFMAYCRYTQSVIHRQKRGRTPPELEQREQVERDIASLKLKITEQIEAVGWTECGFFAKFNSRSPKDVHEYEGEEAYVQELFFRELDRFASHSGDGTVDINDASAAEYAARARLLKMKCADDVISTFSRSFRALEDLTGTSRNGAEHNDISIALRRWNEDVVHNGHGEFRCFVHNGQLNAITQYISSIYFDALEKQSESIKERILKFYAQRVREFVPMDSFVIDFLVLGLTARNDEKECKEEDGKEIADDDIFVIELNPFYKSAGAGLFDWKDDRELFLNGPCEIAVRTEVDPKAKSYMHPTWLRSYEQYNAQKRSGCSCILL